MSDTPKILKQAIAASKRKRQAKEDRLWKRLGREAPSERKARKEDELDIDYNEIPLEKKQKFLDLFNEGIPLGKAAEQAGIDSMMAAQVIIRNAVGLIPSKAIK